MLARARPSAAPVRNPRVAVTIASVASMFMNILDTTIVNVALPSIDREFHASAAVGGLTVVSYLTMLVVVMPISGWLGDRFGTRALFMASLATFTVASVLCGLAQNLPELIAARVIQGVGGGALLPAGMTMMYRVYTPGERLHVARLTAIPQAMAPVLGPTLGGVLVQGLSWRWVFWVNLPVGMIVFAILWFSLAEHREGTEGAFDRSGFVLSALGIGLLVYGISQGAAIGWATAQILVVLILGVALCAALVAVELRSRHPLLRLGLIRIRGYRHSLLITCLCGAGFSGVQFVVPLMLQIRDGYSPIQSGLTTFCEAIGVMVASQIVSRLHVRLGERTLQLGGFILLTALILLLALASRAMGPWALRWVMFGIGLGSGHVQMPNQAMAFDEVQRADTGHASGLYNTSRRLGSAIGVAILASALATSHAAGGAESGFTAAFAAASALTALGTVVAVQALRDRGHRPLLAQR